MAEQTHKTTIVINGESSGAIGALSKVNKALSGVFKSIGQITKFLSRFNWAINAITTVVDGFKKLNEWVHRSETAAKALREELAKSKYDTQVAHAAASYEKLTKHLAEANRLEKERNDILDNRVRLARDLEDADTERKKQLEIAALDPKSANYESQRKTIERKYEVNAAETKANRASEDDRRQSDRLYKEASEKESDARALEKEWEKQSAIAETALERRFKASMAARTGGEDEKSRYEKADSEWKTQYDKAKKIREDIDKILSEAQSLRRKAAEFTGTNLAEKIRADALKLRINNETKAEEAAHQQESQKEEDRRERDRRERKYKIEDAQLNRQKEEEISALDPNAEDYESRRKEIERTYETKRAENREKRIRESALMPDDTDRQLAQQKKQELDALDPNAEDYESRRKEIERTYETKRAENRERREKDAAELSEAEEDRKAVEIRHRRERIEEKTSKVNDYYEKITEQIDNSRPQNRLTAMGLSSGEVRNDRIAREQADNVKLLTRLAKEQLEAIRQIKYDNTSIYAP